MSSVRERRRASALAGRPPRTARLVLAPRDARADLPMEQAIGSNADNGRLMSGRPLLTTAAAAEQLGVSVRAVKKLLSRGGLAYVKIGRATRIEPSEMDRFVARGSRRSARLR